MGFVDIIFMVLIVTGALYLLYSLWKKQGHCPGCDSGTCPTKKFRL